MLIMDYKRGELRYHNPFGHHGQKRLIEMFSFIGFVWLSDNSD